MARMPRPHLGRTRRPRVGAFSRVIAARIVIRPARPDDLEATL
jgi:hypothetical protein